MKNNIIKLLNESKDFFSELVDVEQYAEKIIDKATVIPIIKCGELEAFIAYYDNDPDKKYAYLTMILVSDKAQGMGYGKGLINLSISNLKKLGFEKYKLEVKKNNIKALELYEKLGFRTVEFNEISIHMLLIL